MKRGDIVLVEYPFTDTSGSKLRPVLVVSADEFNSGEDVVIVPLSSQASDPRFALEVIASAPDFHRTGLRAGSWIKWTKVITISRTVARRRLGSLPDNSLEAVLSNIRKLFA